MKYGNDLLLTDLARRLKNEGSSLDAYLTDGNLEAILLRAKTMRKTLAGLVCRVHDIKDGRV